MDGVRAFTHDRPAFSPQPRRKGNEKPKPIEKIESKRAKDNRERAIKKQVRERDKVCRVCLYRRSSEVHETRFRSLGGEVSLFNSIGVCAARNGGLCHQLLQTHDIEPTFKQPARGADGAMTFSMNRSVADAVFGRNAIPKHITVAE